MKTKTIFLAGIFLLSLITVVWAETAQNKVEFRLVLSVDNVQKMLNENSENKNNYDEINSGNEVLYIEKTARLTDKDIVKFVVRKSDAENGMDSLVLNFSEEGRTKLFNFTKEFAGKRIAVFIGKDFISASKVFEPVSNGSLVIIPGSRSVEELGEILKKNGIVPEYEKISYSDKEKEEIQNRNREVLEIVDKINKKGNK